MGGILGCLAVETIGWGFQPQSNSIWSIVRSPAFRRRMCRTASRQNYKQAAGPTRRILILVVRPSCLSRSTIFLTAIRLGLMTTSPTSPRRFFKELRFLFPRGCATFGDTSTGRLAPYRYQMCRPPANQLFHGHEREFLDGQAAAAFGAGEAQAVSSLRERHFRWGGPLPFAYGVGHGYFDWLFGIVHCEQ